MPGMKRDCGGAAAVLGAFYVAVKQVQTVSHYSGYELHETMFLNLQCF